MSKTTKNKEYDLMNMDIFQVDKSSGSGVKAHA